MRTHEPPTPEGWVHWSRPDGEHWHWLAQGEAFTLTEGVRLDDGDCGVRWPATARGPGWFRRVDADGEPLAWDAPVSDADRVMMGQDIPF